MRTVTFKIKDYATSWNSLAAFTSVWVMEYVKSQPYFKKDEKLLAEDILFAADGFFHYYGLIITAQFPEQSQLKQLVTEGIQLGTASGQVVCQVPHQEVVWEMIDDIAEYWEYLEHLKIKTADEDRIDRAWAFKQSITLDKLQQLMRWGFVEAHNLIPDNEGNAETLRSFFQAFDRLPHCKFLAPLFDSLEFEVEDGAHVKWDLFLVKADGERVHYQELPKHLK